MSRSSIIYDTRIDAAAMDAARRDSATAGPRGRAPIPVAETYPRRGAWSGQNQLGVELPFTASVDHPQTLLKMDEWGFPSVWTISLGYRLDGDVPPGSAFDALAEIEFGAGGITQTLVADWVDGTILSLPLNAVNIRARWNNAQKNFPFPEGVRLSVQLGRGECSAARATRSLPAFVGAGATTAINPAAGGGVVPAFARSVRLLPGDPASVPLLYAATFQFNFSANVSGATGDGSITGNFLGPNVAMPIPPFARYFTMTNGSASPLVAIPVFSLVGP